MCSAPDPGLGVLHTSGWEGKRSKSPCWYCSPLAPVAREEVADPENVVSSFDGIGETHTDNEEGRDQATRSFNQVLPFPGQTLGFQENLVVKCEHGTERDRYLTLAWF